MMVYDALCGYQNGTYENALSANYHSSGPSFPFRQPKTTKFVELLKFKAF